MQTYEPKVSTQCKAGEHTGRKKPRVDDGTGCQGTAYSMAAGKTLNCACPCHLPGAKAKLH